MIKLSVLIIVGGMSLAALAQEEEPAPVTSAPAETSTSEPAQDRAPAQDPSAAHTNDDELRVQSQLPEAQLKRDARSMQNEVYKSIYNRELKPDQREDVLDE